MAIRLAVFILYSWRCASWPFDRSSSGDNLESLRSLVSDLQAEVRSLRVEQKDLRRRLDGCSCSHIPDLAAIRDEDINSTDDEDAEVPQESSREVKSASIEYRPDETNDIVNVDVGNTEWLKEVLFGGRPWVIYCDDKSNKKRLPPPKVFQESAVQLKGVATFGMLDCWERTTSGKTLAHRFDFPMPPVMFAVANGDPPMVVNLDGLSKPWQLRRKVQTYLSAVVTRVDNAKTFKSACVTRRACLIIGFKTAPMLAETLSFLQPLLEEHRGVRAVSVDTSVWKVKLDDKLASTKPKKKEGQKERADMVCIARRSGSQSRGGAFFRLTGEASPTTDNLEVFLDRCASGKNLIGMSETPQISLRPPDKPKAYYPPPAPRTSPTPTPPSGSGKTTTKGKAPAPKNTAKRQMPRYSNSGKSPSRKSGISSKSRGSSGRKQDHVGSRTSLEEEEPLFSAVQDGPDDAEHVSEDESSDNDAGEEEVEL